MSNDVVLPTQVSYDATDVAQATAKEQLKNGAVVKVVIEKAEPKLAKLCKGQSGPGENMILQEQLYVVHPDTGAKLKKFRLFNRAYVPLKHPDYKDTMSIPHWMYSMWAGHVRAFLPEQNPALPTRKGKDIVFNGNVIDPRERAGIEQKLAQMALDTAIDVWEKKGTPLMRTTAYATIKYSEYEGNTYVNLDKFRAELYEKESLTPYAELVEVVTAEGDVVQSATTESKPKTKKPPRK